MAKKSVKRAIKQLAPELETKQTVGTPGTEVKATGQVEAAKVSPAPATAKSNEPALAVIKAVVPPVPEKVMVHFALLEPDAKNVSLCGEFNRWSPGATPMQRDSKGHWEAAIALAPGRYQYKFFVDGEWIPDPLARENVFNSHGTLNSVILVQS